MSFVGFSSILYSIETNTEGAKVIDLDNLFDKKEVLINCNALLGRYKKMVL